MNQHHSVEPLPAAELSGFMSAVEKRYAQQKTELGSVPADEARSQARAEVAALFPDGRLQTDHVVLQACDQNGQELGFVWIGPHRAEPGLAFIYDLVVDERARGQGLGRQLLGEAETWARDNGYTPVSLHVFGGNATAIGLYESKGYTVTDLLMRRPL